MFRKPLRGFLALGLFLLVLCSMPVHRARSECLSGLCIQKQCTEGCCGEPIKFYHYTLDPSPYMEADKQWDYIYKLCPGSCEDVYPYRSSWRGGRAAEEPTCWPSPNPESRSRWD